MSDQVDSQQAGAVVGSSAAARLDRTAAQRSEARRLLRAFMRQRLGVVGLVIIVLFALLAIFAGQIAPYHWRDQNIPDRFQNASREHLLGTDELGRDIFSRILYGARYSLVIGVAAVAVSFAIGAAIGMISGFYTKLDSIIMRLIDVLMAFPGILLAIAIVAALGPGLRNVIIAIAVNEIPGFARLTRSMVLSLRERDYVLAARVVGGTDLTIIRRHILVNLVSPIIVFASLRVSTSILVAATLSFLGLGIQPPTPEWGAMVSTARQYLSTAPHTFFYPTMAIFITVIAFNLLGDSLRDVLDPTLRD
jgi:ABC-type dipeptide/oligopeptide/nickel transport system permease subunit